MDALIERTIFDNYVGRDDHNLAEFPLFSVTKSTDRKRNTLITESETEHRLNRGEYITRRQKIVASDEFGLPTESDGDVLIAVFSVADRNSRGPRVYFSRYDLIQFMGWPNTGKSYKRLDQSLDRWISTSIHYENWWDDVSGSYCRRSFNVLNDFKTVSTTAQAGQSELPLSYVEFTPAFLQTWAGSWPKSLDLQTYYKLRGPVAKLAYRFLDKRLRAGREDSFDLRAFATQHLGLKGETSTGKPLPPSKLRERLTKAIDELEEVGFLAAASSEERYRDFDGKEPRIYLRKARPQAPKNPLVDALVERGVFQATAEKLVSDPSIPEDRIRDQIEAVDWLIEKGGRSVPEKPDGYLVAAIRNGYSLPAGFESRQQREARLERQVALAKMKAAEKSKAIAKQQKIDDQNAFIAAARWQAAEAHLLSLPPSEREQFENQAIIAAGGFPRRFINQYLADRSDRSGIGFGFYKDALISHYEKNQAAV